MTIQNEHLEDVLTKQKTREVSDSSWIVSIDEIKAKNFDISPKNPNNDDSATLLPPEKIIREIESNGQEVVKLVASLKELLK